MEKMKKGISALLAFVMLVSVMLCNMVVSVSAAESATWSFGSGSKYRDTETAATGYIQTIQYGSSTVPDNAEYDDLKVTTPVAGSKFDLVSNTSWAQVNTGTKIEIPVTGNSTIKITTYNTTAPFTVDGKSYTSADTIVYEGEAGTVEFIMGANDYISTISVTPIEDEVLPTAFADEWNFRSGSALMGTTNGVSVQGGTETIEQGDAVLKIDASASGAKWDSTRADWAQANAGTIISVPVDAGNYTITVTINGAGKNLSIDGQSLNTGTGTTASATITNESARYVDIVMGADDYIGSITITKIEEEVPPTAFAEEWNFRSGSSLINTGVELEGTTGTVEQGQAVLKIDATKGKWSTNRTDYVQVNAGTIISVPVDAGIYTISVTTFNESKKLSIDGVSLNSGSAKCVNYIVNNESARYVPIVMEDSDYIGVIK